MNPVVNQPREVMTPPTNTMVRQENLLLSALDIGPAMIMREHEPCREPAKRGDDSSNQHHGSAGEPTAQRA